MLPKWQICDMIADMRISSHISRGLVPVAAPFVKTVENSDRTALRCFWLAAVPKTQDFCGELVNGCR
jgi:hypothetical protein